MTTTIGSLIDKLNSPAEGGEERVPPILQGKSLNPFISEELLAKSRGREGSSGEGSGMNLEEAVEVSKLDCPRSDLAGEALRVLVAELGVVNEIVVELKRARSEDRDWWNQRLREALLRERELFIREKELYAKLAATEAERGGLQRRILAAPTTRPRPQPDPAYGQITCVTRPEYIGKRVALVVMGDGE